MATIKSYSDLEQSRKLAEILPLESADMYWMHGKLDNVKQHPTPNIIGNDHDEPLWNDYDIPCWSLASLLELLPKRIEIVDNVYELSVYLYGIYYWNITNGNLCFESKDKDNFVDACYEAIVFLHEQKLL